MVMRSTHQFPIPVDEVQHWFNRTSEWLSTPLISMFSRVTCADGIDNSLVNLLIRRFCQDSLAELRRKLRASFAFISSLRTLNPCVMNVHFLSCSPPLVAHHCDGPNIKLIISMPFSHRGVCLTLSLIADLCLILCNSREPNWWTGFAMPYKTLRGYAFSDICLKRGSTVLTDAKPIYRVKNCSKIWRDLKMCEKN